MRTNANLTVQPSAVIFLALAVLVLPLQWVAAWCVSTAVHEAGHLLAAKLLSVRVCGIEFGTGGARIKTEPMAPTQELLCSMAGPMCGGTLILLGPWFPRLAICAFLQTAYNLLPLGHLDGSRILRSVLELLHFQQAEAISHSVETVVLALLAVLGLYLSVLLRLGILPLVWAGSMIFRLCREKFLANRQKKGYNRPSIDKEVTL